MLDPTKVGFEKVGFEKRLNPKSRIREKFGRVFRKDAIERLHAKKVEFEQSWIREKLDLNKLEVGFEKAGFQKSDSIKVEPG